MRRRSSRRWIAVLGISLATLAYAPLGFAQEATDADIAQARTLAGQAQAAYEAGNYPESEKLWAAAAKLYPKAPTLALGLARAAAKNGHVVLAQENYNKIIREWAEVAQPPPAFKDALDAARAEVGEVSKRVAGVVITITGPDAPTVTVDGAVVPPAALGLRRPVDPGDHVVHAEAPGWKAGDTKFNVAEGGTADAKLAMDKAPEVPGGGGANGPVIAKKGSNKTLAIVALGVGGVGLVVGTVTGIIAIGKHGDLADACKDGKCASDRQSDIDSYSTVGTISTVSFIVGAVGVAAGAVLWVTAPKESASAGTPASRGWATIRPAKDVTMTPFVGPTSAGVTGRF